MHGIKRRSAYIHTTRNNINSINLKIWDNILLSNDLIFVLIQVIVHLALRLPQHRQCRTLICNRVRPLELKQLP